MKLKKIIQNVAVCGVGAAVIAISGCTADKAEHAGFVEKPEMMKKYDFLPFHKAWKEPGVNLKSYNKIMVMPVFNENQLKKSWLERNHLRSYLNKDDKDLKDFTDYTENAFKQAIEKDSYFKLVNKPGPNTMILELALVKIVPGKPILGAFGNITNLSPVGFLLMPIKVGIKASSDSPMQSSVAMEGFFRDSETGKVIATFADREKQRAAIFNLNDFTTYGNHRQIVDEWAKQLIEVLHLKEEDIKAGKKVERSSKLEVINY